MRDARLDVLRGWCIVSMTVGHLAGVSLVDRVTHPLRWVDGAAGFVLLSGVVLGMVQRPLQARSPRAGHAALLRRAGIVLGVHTAMAVGGVAARTVTGSPPFVPTFGELGGVGQTVTGVATLRLQPDFLNVLPLYVALLLLAQPAVAALRAERWRLVLGCSVAIWGVGQLTAGPLTPAHLLAPPVQWDWAGWQLLFVGGLMVGWYAEQVRAAVRAHRRLVIAGATLVALLVTIAAQRFFARGIGVLDALTDKYAVGALVPVALAAASLAGYAFAGRAFQSPLLRPGALVLGRIGRRSLDCFVLLFVIEAAAYSLPAGTLGPRSVLLVIATVLALMWALATAAVARGGWVPCALRVSTRPRQRSVRVSPPGEALALR